jgi:outer membrane receptor protein involved in Fe transport
MLLLSAGAAPAQASREVRAQVDIRGGRLADALAEFARESGAEILFDPKLVPRIDVRSVRGRLSMRETLSQLLAGTGLEYRQTGGSFVLFRSELQQRSTAAEDLPVPEILVIGRRTQNSDIRRTENDIQPYKVKSSREIDRAIRDDVEQFMRSREPANAQFASPSQVFTTGGDTRSAIDLRGLGTSRTLVLVDGRRVPSIPTLDYDHQQPDLNAIPLSAIERIETLTGTAGGIYGPSALGGVVNIILKRDYEGAFLRVSSGITSRGDAATGGAEGRIGFTFNDQRTSVTLGGGLRRSEPLRRGRRDYGVRQRLLQYGNDPQGYLSQSVREGRFFDAPSSNVVSVFSTNGTNLVLDPAFGGVSLNAPYTFLPLDFSGTREEAVEILKQNAGALIFQLPDDLTGGNFYLRSNPSLTSAFANIRQRIGTRIEAYLDTLLLRNVGKLEGSGYEVLPSTVANAPTNPFAQSVRFRFPRTDLVGGFRQRIDTRRFTAGLIVELPGEWNAAADYTAGSTKVTRAAQQKVIDLKLVQPLAFGTPGPGGLPILNPLAPWDEFRSALEAYRTVVSIDETLKNRFSDASLRLAGPIVDLPGGPLTATALLERRREHVPVAERRRSIGGALRPVAERTQTVSSAYVELRAPLTDADGPLPLLRDLQVQLALRYDRSVTLYPDGFGAVLETEEAPTRSRRGAFTYTAGAKFLPIPALMLRASLATGELPPTIGSLLSGFTVFRGTNAAFADPLRANRPAGSERSFRILFGGLPSSAPERAQTLSVGVVLNPKAIRWPRMSIDYSEVRKRREPYSLTLNSFFDQDSAFARIPQLIATEGSGPSRILRAPLSAADRDRGFTVGPITHIDARGLNEGKSILKVVDMQLDWLLPTNGSGEFRVYGTASWQPSLRRRASSREPWVQLVGFADGPIEWRANGGLDWTSGGLTLGINAQYFGSYSPLYSAPVQQIFNSQIARFHGGERIPAQVYLDLSVRRRFEVERGGGPIRRVEIGLGIVNLLDRSPPITADVQSSGYSYYGDPRRRRFELALSSSF